MYASKVAVFVVTTTLFLFLNIIFDILSFNASAFVLTSCVTHIRDICMSPRRLPPLCSLAAHASGAKVDSPFCLTSTEIR
jgi:hypothetical protein